MGDRELLYRSLRRNPADNQDNRRSNGKPCMAALRTDGLSARDLMRSIALSITNPVEAWKAMMQHIGSFPDQKAAIHAAVFQFSHKHNSELGKMIIAGDYTAFQIFYEVNKFTQKVLSAMPEGNGKTELSDLYQNLRKIANFYSLVKFQLQIQSSDIMAMSNQVLNPNFNIPTAFFVFDSSNDLLAKIITVEEYNFIRDDAATRVKMQNDITGASSINILPIFESVIDSDSLPLVFSDLNLQENFTLVLQSFINSNFTQKIQVQQDYQAADPVFLPVHSKLYASIYIPISYTDESEYNKTDSDNKEPTWHFRFQLIKLKIKEFKRKATLQKVSDYKEELSMMGFKKVPIKKSLMIKYQEFKQSLLSSKKLHSIKSKQDIIVKETIKQKTKKSNRKKKEIYNNTIVKTKLKPKIQVLIRKKDKKSEKYWKKEFNETKRITKRNQKRLKLQKNQAKQKETSKISYPILGIIRNERKISVIRKDQNLEILEMIKKIRKRKKLRKLTTSLILEKSNKRKINNVSNLR